MPLRGESGWGSQRVTLECEGAVGCFFCRDPKFILYWPSGYPCLPTPFPIFFWIAANFRSERTSGKSLENFQRSSGIFRGRPGTFQKLWGA